MTLDKSECIPWLSNWRPAGRDDATRKAKLDFYNIEHLYSPKYSILLKCQRQYCNKRIFVQLICGNDHIKQPKLLSWDAFSELEVFQNAFAAEARRWTSLQKL